VLITPQRALARHGRAGSLSISAETRERRVCLPLPRAAVEPALLHHASNSRFVAAMRRTLSRSVLLLPMWPMYMLRRTGIVTSRVVLAYYIENGTGGVLNCREPAPAP